MIKLDNIILNIFEEKHLEQTLKWVNDLVIMACINRVLPVTMSEHKEWYQNIIRDKRQVIFAIEDAGDGSHLGNCGLKDIDLRSKKAELWIYLGKDNISKGKGKNAVDALVRYGFDYLNLNRIYLYTLDFNKKAIRAFGKSGFLQEGVFRQDVYINGEYHDTVRMAVLRDERGKIDG